MQPVLFHIPLSWLNAAWPDIPIYGYGMMLFAAFLAVNWLGKRLCRKENINPDIIPDLAICLFVTGILGGRIVYIIQYRHNFDNFVQMITLWYGGLVLYGALFGGALGYFGFWWFSLRKQGISNFKMFDILAPCIVVGVALGRIGCLCTGCCYGNVACGSQPALHFPSPSQPWKTMTDRGYQTPYGFTLNPDMTIDAVEPASAADSAGMKAKDLILAINGKAAKTPFDLKEEELPWKLTVMRGNATVNLEVTPTSVGLHPTQIYETISMCLLLFFLLSYYPYRQWDGELMVLLMFGYAIHRFLNEMLRTDTDPVAFGLTLSQNISILIFATGVVMAFLVYRRPRRGEEPPPAPVPEGTIQATPPEAAIQTTPPANPT
jgi:phosphatidylglycerol:prolipoprotein diacylglycerol transferase